MVKIIRKIPLWLLVLLFCSCRKMESSEDAHSIDAQLVGVTDNIDWAHFEDSVRERNDTLPSSRNLILVYRIVNKCQDSIYFPRKRYNNSFHSEISASHPNHNVYVRNMGGPTIIAPRDTAFIRFMVFCVTSVKEEKEVSPSYTDLLSSLKLKYTLNPDDKKDGIHNIDSIIFHNDTTGIWVDYTEPGVFIDYE